jgi:hypothetical protein
LDERDPEQEKLIKLARQIPDLVQAGGEGATASCEDIVAGRWFIIGAFNIDNVTVNASASGPLEEGTDYELDRQNGRIRVIPDAGVSDGENLNLTFDQPAIRFEKYESQFNPLFYCDIIIEEHNQYHKLWLRQMKCTAYLNVTEFPTQTGEFGHFRIKATPSGPVTVLKRPGAQSIPDVTASVEGPAHSSSSSSTSSSTSSASNSSQSS